MLIVRTLKQQLYSITWQAMRAFTQQRDATTPDELWFVEHEPVFTLGQTGKTEHLLDTGAIPVINSDRGGQVTYHGPGQLILYPLVDLRRRRLTVRQWVTAIEQSVIQTLAHFFIQAYARPEAPGIYVFKQKIASLGLRICRGCSLHGVALNISMDLAPFKRINPCGYVDLQMTQVVDWVSPVTFSQVQSLWLTAFAQQLDEHDIHWVDSEKKVDGETSHA